MQNFACKFLFFVVNLMSWRNMPCRIIYIKIDIDMKIKHQSILKPRAFIPEKYLNI